MSNLKNELSKLTYEKACDLLGAGGEYLLQKGGLIEIDPDHQVLLSSRLLWVELDSETTVSFLYKEERKKAKLNVRCSRCSEACEHIGAALAFVLEEKKRLGLDDAVEADDVSDVDLRSKALLEREERSRQEKLSLEGNEGTSPWSDYTVRSFVSGKSYHLSIRGLADGESHCSCPDFRKNTLGTCKHLIFALREIRSRFSPQALAESFVYKEPYLTLTYGEQQKLHLRLPQLSSPELFQKATKFNKNNCRPSELLNFLEEIQTGSQQIVISPDASDYIDRQLYRLRIKDLVKDIRSRLSKHPLRTSLLKEELRPYQLEGAAFALASGRAIIADETGLGKTVQALAFAELLKRESGIRRTLVVCATSVQEEWEDQIERFSPQTCTLVKGNLEERAERYDSSAFFTVCRYDQILEDRTFIERSNWDLIILDEGHRVNNWENPVHKVIRDLKSSFALVLTGMPPDQNLDELYSLASFVDERRLGPAFYFFHKHRSTSDAGESRKGFSNEEELRRKLAPILIRRTRDQVHRQMPQLNFRLRLIPPGPEQRAFDVAQRSLMRRLLQKKHTSSTDFMALRQALLAARLSANAPYLANPADAYESAKMLEVDLLLRELLVHRDCKIVIISEWKRSLDLLAQKLDTYARHRYEKVDESLSEVQREKHLQRFHVDESCNLLLMTRSQSEKVTNLSAATVIYLDAPSRYNGTTEAAEEMLKLKASDAVLVYQFISQGTLEENLYLMLSFPQSDALSVFAGSDDVDLLEMSLGIDQFRPDLEKLLSYRKEPEEVSEVQVDSQQVAEAAGRLLSSALQMAVGLIPGQSQVSNAQSDVLAAQLKEQLFVEENGQLYMKVKLPEEDSLKALAARLASLVHIEQ